MKLEHSPTPYTKINTKCIKDLNVRPGTIKLLEENLGRTLLDIICSSIFFRSVSSGKGNKSKNNQMGHKSFWTAKETINKMKRQPTEWKKIFANDVTNKGLIFKISKKQTTQLKNGQKI